MQKSLRPSIRQPEFVRVASVPGRVRSCPGSLIAAALNAARIAVPISVQLFLMSDKLHLAVHFQSLASSVALLTAVTALAALYPSFRAARLKPVTAMSHFG